MLELRLNMKIGNNIQREIDLSELDTFSMSYKDAPYLQIHESLDMKIFSTFYKVGAEDMVINLMDTLLK